MTIAFSKLFEPNMVDNAAVETIYTVPATPTTSLLRNGVIRFSNITAVSVTITAYAVPLSGSASTTNMSLPTVSVPAYSFIDWAVPTLKAGDFVQAQAGAATSINAQFIDGFLQT